MFHLCLSEAFSVYTVCMSKLNELHLRFCILQEGKHGAVLTVTVNDLGNHGCYPNCNEIMTLSLFAAHAFGAVIVIESISVLCLGLMLLFFICKCAIILLQEKKRQKGQHIELSKIQDSSKQAIQQVACLQSI